MGSLEHAVIVGAGFSKHAGLPLTTEFTEALLDVARFRRGLSKYLVASLRRFVADVFSCPEDAPADSWPTLEDLFTFIDLSANTGHHLGREYPAATLRTVRRALIARTIRMLHQEYKRGKDERALEWIQVTKFLRRVNIEEVAFVSMNWDVAIEARLFELGRARHVDYGCDAGEVSLGNRKAKLVKQEAARAVTVFKLHGSINWLYCDNCRQLFWCHPEEAWKIADLLLSEADWRTLQQLAETEKDQLERSRGCPRCRGDSLSTRVATFSFRKALDFPMFRKSWESAESLLWKAASWTFIGYSLPAGDFEFKHMLKRIQLSRGRAPRIILITGGDKRARASTIENYRRLFGGGLRSIFEHGLDEDAMRWLTKEGILNLG